MMEIYIAMFTGYAGVGRQSFAHAVRDAAGRLANYGPDTFGRPLRVVSADPFLDGWRQVNDETWPFNWSAYIVRLEDGKVTVAAADGWTDA